MKLLSVAANQHVFDGRTNGKPIRLLLTFDEELLRLSAAGDGQTMLSDGLSLDEPFDMNDYGRIVISDVTQTLFPALLNATVNEVRSLELGGRRVGVRLCLANNDDADFWVDGDELFWGFGEAMGAHNWVDGVIPTVAASLHL